MTAVRGSAQVLDAIGRALRLDPDARGHLFRLAGLNPRLGPDNSRDSVHPALLRLLDAFPTSAAYVLSPAFDVLATNSVAAALLSPFTGPTNMVRVLFHHPPGTCRLSRLADPDRERRARPAAQRRPLSRRPRHPDARG